MSLVFVSLGNFFERPPRGGLLCNGANRAPVSGLYVTGRVGCHVFYKGCGRFWRGYDRSVFYLT